MLFVLENCDYRRWTILRGLCLHHFGIQSSSYVPTVKNGDGCHLRLEKENKFLNLSVLIFFTIKPELIINYNNKLSFGLSYC